MEKEIPEWLRRKVIPMFGELTVENWSEIEAEAALRDNGKITVHYTAYYDLMDVGGAEQRVKIKFSPKSFTDERIAALTDEDRVAEDQTDGEVDVPDQVDPE